MLPARLRVVAALLALSTLTIPARSLVTAQNRAIDIYAITNARIVTVSGPVIEKGNVVIRDGLIAAVGDKITPPADATIIDGSGLTIYPGLIDANTNLGLPEPSPAPSPGQGGGGGLANLLRQASAPAASGPNSTQPVGLQPEIMVEDTIKPGGASIEAERNIGITSALTAPRTGIWMGQSALINLAGETPQQMIVRSPVAMHIGFTPLRTGNYPNSLMGVFAVLRQMLLDAQRYNTALQTYERSPRGMRRPDLDRSLAALIPVLEGKMPVVMYADRERDIRRALDLAQEFNLKAIIAGGTEAAAVVDKLRERDVPVLLSLNLPKRTTAASADADPESLRVLRQRIEAQKTAGKLAAARVRFAFQSGGLSNPADFLANANREIANGLSKDDALRAMTLRAAEILGVGDRLGSIEAGKIANLTITKGDLFDRGSRVTTLFIDGRQVEVRAAPAPPAGGGQGQRPDGAQPPEETRPTFTGTWTVSLSISGQTFPGTMVLKQEGGAISGSLQTDVGASEFSGGTITGDSFHAVGNATIQGQAAQLTIDGTIQGNSITGTVQTPFGTATYTGSRNP